MFKVFFMVIIVFFSTLTQAKSIVVLGDSISANYGFATEKGWVSLLTQQIQKSYPQYTVHNQSISGDTTAGGLARLPKILTTYHPDIVLVELGANDGLRGMSLLAMQNNLSTIIKKSQQAGAKVLLLSMRIPSNYGKRYTEMFYNSYASLAEKYKIVLVPFILQDIALNKSYLQADGLHPNAQAQPTIAAHIRPYLWPLL